MQALTTETSAVRDELLQLGFLAQNLQQHVPLWGNSQHAALLGFASRPFDSRTAAIVAADGPPLSRSDVQDMRPTGAAVVFACQPTHYHVWKQGAAQPEFVCQLTRAELPGFFRVHAAELAPEAIYRAKTWARLEPAYQQDLFVDTGLLPAVETTAGEHLRRLIERVVSSTKRDLGWATVSEEDGKWLLKANFWLLAAKILRDKGVPGFTRLSLTDLDNVYARLARHYNHETPSPVLVGDRRRRIALESAAAEIQRFAPCNLVSTETLAYLYESALIDRATRQRLGTHSTPPWLVDYVVGRLRPWIREIPVEERSVFEPACGHAAFLISSMRLLAELLPPTWPGSRREYLRRRLHGMESDPFALEIARLSLTLTDVPNPNGWNLAEADMFVGDRLQGAVRPASIALGNPPFERFTQPGSRGRLQNKAAETFRQVVDNLRPGGVFGFLLPQSFLHGRDSQGVRETLLRDYDVAEISLFADQVFRHGDVESALLIGRRRSSKSGAPGAVRYQRIREGQVTEFARTCTASSTLEVRPERFAKSDDVSFVVPDLDAIWRHLAGMPQLCAFAEVGQGFSHISTAPENVRAATRASGFTPGFAGWDEEQATHLLPKVEWLNLEPDVIDRPRHGTAVGKPQVLFNYAPTSRRGWRLKALIDEDGHPVTSRYNVARPKHPRVSLLALWGLLNSPVGNAYAACHCDKRNVPAGIMRRMPVPDLENCNLALLEKAVSNYLLAARKAGKGGKKTTDSRRPAQEQLPLFGMQVEPEIEQGQAAEELKFLHWRIDAEVIRLYDLPAHLQRELLDLFSDGRRGVPFKQTEYFPAGYKDLDTLSDLLAITGDWKSTNRRRGQLMALEDEDRLTSAQTEELENLQRLADALLSLMAPWKADEVDRAVAASKEQGAWKA